MDASGANPDDIDDIPDLDGPSSVSQGLQSLSFHDGSASDEIPTDIPDIDDIPDMEEEDLEEDEDLATAKTKPNVLTVECVPLIISLIKELTCDRDVGVAKGNLLQVRTYDVMITYDKYYQTPRIWLLGYDEVRACCAALCLFHDHPQNGSPLTTPQIFQDVSADHALKTVTIEPFPHGSFQAASVHPCKHASVMKKVIERMNTGVLEAQQSNACSGSTGKDGGKRKWLSRKITGADEGKKASPVGEDEEVEGMRVDFYLVVFLKFIASIVPTIEVDSTTSF